MIKVVLAAETEVTAGVDGSEEELFLSFSAHTPSKPNLEALGLDDFDVVLDLENSDPVPYLAALPRKPMDFEWEQGERIEFITGLYEHRWSGTKEDAKKFILDDLKNPENWSRKFDSEDCSFSQSLWVSGNAD